MSNITPILTDRPLTSTLVLVFKFMEFKCLFTNNRGRQIKGNNSCKPPFGACENGGNYHIGTNSCIWPNACNDISTGEGGDAVIGNNSCNGIGACVGVGEKTKGTIGNGSCNYKACHYNGRPCNFNGGCQYNKGTVGNDSCDGNGACFMNEGTIDNGCCNWNGACQHNKGHIKAGSDKCCARKIWWRHCSLIHWCGSHGKQIMKTYDGCSSGFYKIKCERSYCKEDWPSFFSIPRRVSTN